jgi:thioredoxin reductase (NADPH)
VRGLVRPSITTLTSTKPIFSLVEPSAFLARDLRRRFGADYDVITAADAASGLEFLRRARDEDVALVIAPYRMQNGMPGTDYFVDVRDAYPGAKRLLEIDVGDVGAQQDIRRALTLNQIDFFFGTPWESPEEELYPVIGEALRLWARQHAPRYSKATILDAVGSPKGREMQTNMARNAVTTTLHTIDSDEGRAYIHQHELSTDRLPILILWDGRVLVDPDRPTIAEAMGARTRPGTGTYDVAIVGAGPAGLAAAAYAASEGLRAIVVEADTAGGQAGTSAKIRNYLGFRWGISGGEFGERAWRQAEELGADFVVVRTADRLRPEGANRIITLSNGDEIVARSVVIAAGVAYRRLGIPEVDDLVGAGVFYGAAVAEAQSMAGLNVYVLGGGNSSGQAATHLAAVGAKTTILIRGENLGEKMSDYLVKEVQAAPNLSVRTNTTIVGAGTSKHLDSLVLRDTNGRETVPADALFVFIGAQPHTEWLTGTLALDENRFILTGRDLTAEQPAAWGLDRPPAFLETSMPGVFAVGDIRHGSVKRVAAAVGEGSTACLFIKEYLEDRP